jgi:hypothetical protein
VNQRIRQLGIITILTAAVLASVAVAQVLPEDRADILYHSFDGGGVTITGPSILLRKKLINNFSGYANYYVDSISSASIDVLSYASPYEEKRTEVTVGGDYLLGETILSGGFTNSDESDFKAQTAYFGVSQEIFGGLTTIRMGFARDWDEVGMVNDPDFAEDVDRRSYRLGATQVITKNLLLNFDFEGITDEGFLNNPYRQVRYLDATEPAGFDWQAEVYPNTRTSSAFSIGGRYFVQSGSAVYGSARIFNDTWGIDAWNAQLGYTFSTRQSWLFDFSYRYYTQQGADFYSDLFDYSDQQNFMARDKELSTFTDHSIRLAISYEIPVASWEFVERGTANFSYDYMFFKYDDFRNVLKGGVAGTEPLYDMSADIFQLYVSFWF